MPTEHTSTSLVAPQSARCIRLIAAAVGCENANGTASRRKGIIGRENGLLWGVDPPCAKGHAALQTKVAFASTKIRHQTWHMQTKLYFILKYIKYHFLIVRTFVQSMSISSTTRFSSKPKRLIKLKRPVDAQPPSLPPQT